MPITSSGLIPNEKGPKANPRELEDFEYQVQFSDPAKFCTHIMWSIYGDVPKGITIDSGSGKISGNIKALFDQPSASDNFPEEDIKFDGTNWDKDGRFKPLFFDFHFTVQRNTMTLTPQAVCSIPVVETASIFIKEIKCQNINNLLYIKRYLDSSEKSPDGLKETAINVDGVEYTDYKSLEPVHPGPFTCPPK